MAVDELTRRFYAGAHSGAAHSHAATVGAANRTRADFQPPTTHRVVPAERATSVVTRSALAAAAVLVIAGGGEAARAGQPQATAVAVGPGIRTSAGALSPAAAGAPTPLPAASGAAAGTSSGNAFGAPANPRTQAARPAASTTSAPPAATSADPSVSARRVSRDLRRAPLTASGATVAGTWIIPTHGRYTSCFCARWGTFHAGIDLAAPLGTPIVAVGSGVVLKAGPASGFGNWVVIRHGNGDVSIYGHMRHYFVAAGDVVHAGERIALVGSQGQATGPHLHFEIRRGGLDGTKINPIPWLRARGIRVGPYLGN